MRTRTKDRFDLWCDKHGATVMVLIIIIATLVEIWANHH